jgi:hypothetical protein
VSRSAEQNVQTTVSFLNPLSESEKLQPWGCLTFKTPSAILRTTRFNVKKFYMVLALR